MPGSPRSVIRGMIPGSTRANGRTVDLVANRHACSGTLGPAPDAGWDAEGGLRELSDLPVRAHPAPRGRYLLVADRHRALVAGVRGRKRLDPGARDPVRALD